ncbi:MAG: uroporphyrinogen decarboxylase [Actinobacteria bacterium]|nr:uroporphyrinogen decarboxylase [Actinomycetota bacterium]
MTPVDVLPVAEPARTNLPIGHPLRDGRTARSPLIQSALGQPVPHTPVWFMRQAGRSLPEYRKLRAGHTMLETCFNTDLTVEITLQPVRRHHVDAAIFFSDIVVPMKAVGVDVEIEPGVGPVIGTPFRTAADIDRLVDLDPDNVASIAAAVRALVGELGSTPLIGFAGAPFTVASYLVEGRPSRDHVHTKALMLSDPTTWNRLLDRIADICSAFLRMQIESGASAVQLFDSWAGALSPLDYERYVLPHSRKVFSSIADLDVPMIHFGVGTGELLGLMEQAGPTVMGIDFRVPLSVAETRFSRPIPLQGNLDPALLFADADSVRAAVTRILDDAHGLPGHIFNLGHGVPPDTNPDVLSRIVELVHDESTRRFAAIASTKN